MQSTKDSFLLTLRERLATLNPARAVVLDGAPQPAVVAAENLPATAAPPLPGVFYLRWGAVHVAGELGGAALPLLALECSITYATAAEDESGQSRGRALGRLDQELLRICDPPHAAKRDATQSPPSELAGRIVWHTPTLDPAEASGATLQRTARLTVFTFSQASVA